MSVLLDIQPSLGAALVVGGGSVATRKVLALVQGGFDVTVVAPAIDERIRATGARLCQRSFAPGDTAGFALVFACTGDREANRLVGEEARAAGILVLVADAQDESTFFSPALHRDGDLQVGVSTGGASPSLAGAYRDRIAAALGEGRAEELAAARGARQRRRRGEPQ